MREIMGTREHPREPEIGEMFEHVKEITDPQRVIPVGEVPEFGTDVVEKGLVGMVVSQGHMGTTERLPIRTDNAAECNIFLVQTSQEGEKNTYTLVHVWAGDLDLNSPGHQREDIASIANEKSSAIAITGTNSRGFAPTARALKYKGITTTKHINVPCGNRYVSAVYRPEQNNVLIRVGSDMDATEVFEYEGF